MESLLAARAVGCSLGCPVEAQLLGRTFPVVLLQVSEAIERHEGFTYASLVTQPCLAAHFALENCRSLEGVHIVDFLLPSVSFNELWVMLEFLDAIKSI